MTDYRLHQCKSYLSGSSDVPFLMIEPVQLQEVAKLSNLEIHCGIEKPSAASQTIRFLHFSEFSPSLSLLVALCLNQTWRWQLLATRKKMQN